MAILKCGEGAGKRRANLVVDDDENDESGNGTGSESIEEIQPVQQKKKQKLRRVRSIIKEREAKASAEAKINVYTQVKFFLVASTKTWNFF